MTTKTNLCNSSYPTELNTKYNELKWQIALENSNIGVWDWDAITNKVFYSKESKKILGFEDFEIDSTSELWDERVHPEDRKKYFSDFKSHVEGENPNYRNEHRIQCKDGTYKWILDRGKVIERDADGKPARIIGTHTDISERKEHEDALSNSFNLITDQNIKLKNFAHIVTHNLKSHSGNIESLLNFYDEAYSGIERQELIKNLKSVSSSLSRTISNLNQIVSIQSNKFDVLESLNVKKYINNAISLFEVEINKSSATIRNNVDINLNICTNPAYLESIFQNLLSNAIKYKHPDRNPIIEFNSETSDGLIHIKITDNGLGINMKKHSQEVFNLYRTFHNNENSEGVGLYLIKNQIESFGGTIGIDSKVNEGTTFTISLPKKNPVN